MKVEPNSSIELGAVRPLPSDGYIDIDILITCDDLLYDYSKLYYALGEDEAYSEERVICFKLRWQHRRERIRLVLPENRGYVRLRLDALPYSLGQCSASIVQLVDSQADDEASRLANLVSLKEWVRRQVERSESEQRANLPHYPESLSLELTAGCNLTCSHCSSHGDAEAHAMNNRREAFGVDALEKLASEAFPSLTQLNLVGRGEPMMVSHRLWAKLVELLDRYRVFLTCVSNGTLLKRRINDEILPVIDCLTVSIDGMSEEVFAKNRGGASLATVLDNVAHYQRLRDRAGLARRPRLGLSWTLKRNNIHQFPDFVRFAKDHDVQLLYVRHLFVFRDKDQSQSLVGSPDLSNSYLERAYELLDGSQIKLDITPLSSQST